MFNKIIATVVTATLSFSATSAFAVNNQVRVIGLCAAYNNHGRQIEILTPGYYHLVGTVRFYDGDNGVKVLARNYETGIVRPVNIATRCLRSYRGLVIRY